MRLAPFGEEPVYEISSSSSTHCSQLLAVEEAVDQGKSHLGLVVRDLWGESGDQQSLKTQARRL